jgi:hypothetical protein
MHALPRSSLARVAAGLILISLLAGLWMTPPVHADVGVRPVLPGGSNIKPEDETPIQMAAETIVMNVRAATGADNAAIDLNPEAYGYQLQPVWFPAVAEVQADFTMRNPTGQPVSLTAWFPLASALEKADWNLNPNEIVPRIEGFRVSAEGKTVDYQVSELPNPKGADKPLLPWASFPLVFPAGGDTLIHVSYILPLQPSIKGNELALYYIFQTGSGWAGPIGRAELIINLPYPASEGTIAGIPPGSFYVPYMMSATPAALPAGATLKGNQARWMWVDLEPGPQDDFSIWLMDPVKWQALQKAREAVQSSPQDGQAWLNLATRYHSLSTRSYNTPSIFSASYLPLAIEAYRKAAILLPEHPAPHAGLALLTLAPYMNARNAPADVIQSVQDEYKTARELEIKNPALVEESDVSSWLVEDVLSMYFYNGATATSDAATLTAEAKLSAPSTTAEAATWTAEAVMADMATKEAQRMLASSATPAPRPTLTMTPHPSPTVQPTRVNAPASSQTLAYILGFGIASLFIVGYWWLRRTRGRGSQ